MSTSQGEAPRSRSETRWRWLPSGTGRVTRQTTLATAPSSPTARTMGPDPVVVHLDAAAAERAGRAQPQASRSTGNARMTSMVRDSAVSTTPR